MAGLNPKTNIPPKKLKWTLKRAGVEFGFDPATIKRRLVASGAAPDADGCYGTLEIFNALAGGNIHAERLRECRERADNLELKNQQLRKELLPAGEVHQTLSQCFIDIKGEILGNGDLSLDQKESLLMRLARVKIAANGEVDAI